MKIKFPYPHPPTNIHQYNITYEQIADGVNGTKDTIQAMIDEALRGSFDFAVIDIARKIIKHFNLDPRNNREIADKLFYYVKDNIKFVRDPLFAELLQSPRRTIELKQGDCDDQATLFAALCLSVGVNIRFVTISVFNHDEFTHVYTEVETDIGWVPYDTVAKGSRPGWEPRYYLVKATWTIDGQSHIALSGWFKKVRKEFSRAWRRVRKEFARFERRVRLEVKRVARRIQEEKRRVFNRIVKEFERWEKKHGMLGKFMVLGVKVLVFGIPVPALWAAVEIFDNPFKLKKDEWLLLAQIGSVMGSLAVAVVTAAGASPLLAESVLSLANTAASIVQVQDGIKQRKELLKKLKAQRTKYAEEERIKREAIAKLEYDIRILEEIDKEMEKYNELAEKIKDENDKKIAQREKELIARNKELLNKYRAKREREYNDYCAEMAKKFMAQPLGVAISEAELLQETAKVEKTMQDEIAKLEHNVKLFNIILHNAKRIGA